MRRWWRTAGLLLSIGCGEVVTGPTVPLNAEFILAPGERARIEDPSVTVHFDGVSDDSRCPADAFCIQAGSATVHITVQSGHRLRAGELHTGDIRPVRHDGLTIALIRLVPYPVGSRTIQDDEYRATLFVSR